MTGMSAASAMSNPSVTERKVGPKAVRSTRVIRGSPLSITALTYGSSLSR